MLQKTNEPPGPIIRFRRHEHLARAGQIHDALYCIEEGWVARYTMLGVGRRQITAIYLPGDYCEPQWLLHPRSNESIIALTPVRVWRIPLQSVMNLDRFASDTRDILSGVLRLLDRQSGWIVSLGRKSAIERICSLLHEFFDRMRAAGRGHHDRFPMPLTQMELADIVGLTPIHVNRVMQDLKARGVIESRNRHFRILDLTALRSLSANAAPSRA